MRILHLLYDHPSNPWVGGGGAVRAYELSRRLALRGHEITFISGLYPGAADYVEGGLSYHFVGSAKNYLISTFSYAASAGAYVLKHSTKYDVVVEDFAAWNPAFSCLLSRRPSVIHVNHKEGLNVLRRWGPLGLPFYAIEALYPRCFRHVTALSEWTRKKLGIGRAFVLPAGISEETLAEGVGKDDGYVFYVGRLLMQNKGLDTLIEAMRLARPGRRLLLAGRGRDEERLRAMARGLDVEFLGFVDEQRKLELMRRAALFVLPSRFEGWGIVALEAAAAGRAVVASDIPELSFVTEAGFGLAFRTGDARDLAGNIDLLMDDEKLRAEMGERALAFARVSTWEKIAMDYEKYLQEVAGAA